MGMFDYVRFSEDWIKKLEIPDTGYQTKDFDEPCLRAYFVGDKLYSDNTLKTVEPGIASFVCYAPAGSWVYVSVVSIDGKIMEAKRVESNHFQNLVYKIWANCPSCNEREVYQINKHIVCCNCDSKLENNLRVKNG